MPQPFEIMEVSNAITNELIDFIIKAPSSDDGAKVLDPHFLPVSVRNVRKNQNRIARSLC